MRKIYIALLVLFSLNLIAQTTINIEKIPICDNGKLVYQYFQIKNGVPLSLGVFDKNTLYTPSGLAKVGYCDSIPPSNDTSNQYLLSQIYIKLDSINKRVFDSVNVHLLNSFTLNSIDSLLSLIQKQDSTINLNLVNITDSISKLITIETPDCIGSNETYYINGTNSVTINASEVCSYTITVIEDEVTFTENGSTSPFNLPVGYTGTSSFKSATRFLINKVSFTGANATSKAIIKVIK
jgi:hypothetical protein